MKHIKCSFQKSGSAEIEFICISEMTIYDFVTRENCTSSKFLVFFLASSKVVN